MSNNFEPIKEFKPQQDILKLKMEDNGILWIIFNHEKKENPFSRIMTQEIMRLTPIINNHPEIKGVIFYGGDQRSFSVGGDFRDLIKLQHTAEVSDYLSEIVDLYQSILSIEVPTMAMIDQYAIGQGLQVALMTDWKIATAETTISMPELKNGVACPLGALILEQLLGRAQMLDLVMGCHDLKAIEAQQRFLINQVVPSIELLAASFFTMEKFLTYATAAFKRTKKIHNQRFINALETVRIGAIEAHCEAFTEKSQERHFKNILKQS